MKAFFRRNHKNSNEKKKKGKKGGGGGKKKEKRTAPTQPLKAFGAVFPLMIGSSCQTGRKKKKERIT